MSARALKRTWVTVKCTRTAVLHFLARDEPGFKLRALKFARDFLTEARSANANFIRAFHILQQSEKV